MTDAKKNLRFNLLSVTDGTIPAADPWANINVYFDQDFKGGDTAQLRMRITNSNAVWKDRVLFADKYHYNGGFGKWAHVALSYNGSTSQAKMYVNGTLISTGIRWTKLLTEQWLDEAAGAGKADMGNLSFNDAASADLVIGNWPFVARGGTNTDTWPTNFKGGIDELKIFDAALTDDQISTMYKAYLSL